MEKKHLLFFGLGLMLLLFAAGCTQTMQEQGTQQGTAQEKATVTLRYLDSEGETILEKSFEVEKGSNAFEAMKSNVLLDYEMFSMGTVESAFVKGIAGVGAPEGHYLALYVNGSYAEKGISDYSIDEDTLIEWKIESLEGFGLQ